MLWYYLCGSDVAKTPQPATVACKMAAQSEYVHVACTFFCMFDADLHAQTVRSDKISASELSPKFIKSVLLVGVLAPNQAAVRVI